MVYLCKSEGAPLLPSIMQKMRPHVQSEMVLMLMQFDIIVFIQPPIPDPNNMRDFVSYPTSGNERLHCTMKRTEDNPEVGGPCYTLYLEYLGGLVPILKGRRISKLRPEFVIMDPKTDGKTGGYCVDY